MKSQMTDLVLAGKCTGRGASGLTAPAAEATAGRSNCSPSRLETATRPRPLPARLRKSRRDAKEGHGGAKILGTLIIQPLRQLLLLQHLPAPRRVFFIHRPRRRFCVPQQLRVRPLVPAA